MLIKELKKLFEDSRKDCMLFDDYYDYDDIIFEGLIVEIPSKYDNCICGLDDATSEHNVDFEISIYK